MCYRKLTGYKAFPIIPSVLATNGVQSTGTSLLGTLHSPIYPSVPACWGHYTHLSIQVYQFSGDIALTYLSECTSLLGTLHLSIYPSVSAGTLHLPIYPSIPACWGHCIHLSIQVYQLAGDIALTYISECTSLLGTLHLSIYPSVQACWGHCTYCIYLSKCTY